MPKLELYYSPTCPFCQKVMRFMESRGMKIDMKPTSDPENRSTLIEVGGMNQVPCLFIDGEPLYESDDIIAYLDKTLA